MGHLKNLEHKKRQLSPTVVQNLLKEEIALLQKELDSQTVVRSALEKAMNCQPLFHDPTYKSLSQPAEDLIKEIARLEMEILHLEKYLLSMYRRNFVKRLSTISTQAERHKTNDEMHIWMTPSEANLHSGNEQDSSTFSANDAVFPNKRGGDILGADALIDGGIGRSQSSLSHYSASSFRAEAVTEAVDAYHSLPLFMLESTSNSNPAEAEQEHDYYGFRETPNWISEEMIKCISTIYYHLSDPPQLAEAFTTSPPPNFSPNNAFRGDGSNEFPGSIFTTVEVHGLLKDSQRLNAVEHLLHNYRCLISRLGQIDPAKLKHEEKLAFWINVHNALAMHAFLVYGVPRGSLKRISLVLKAAYNIGGHTVSVETIQSSILGCRLPRPTQWLQSLFSPKTKFKAGDPRKVYAMKHPEPRLHFALCLGCQSDPTVRVYTAKKVFQELEMAKEEYIQMNMKLHKEQRLAIPKNIELYIKGAGLSLSAISEMVEHSMPEFFRKHSQNGKFWKKIDWIPHNFTFRFLLSHELIG
ncbi:uncharacterized protein LOC127262261 [Andrographis paniculata]|uniref:uncharacterized protein LOC127262261 n=1 Tax=Andrographis paniculata TaxID=175694 RepID=UPI0021E97562|nr:uncharacterized protein LOC127262261 [Andrographis paniculata]XP_051146830.1 uncharacterized protein LOC127262261 [Andrographis paniculata]XP_051146831.1 uncharacterized protein LOC127262261 [Andrographis paniculata]